MTGEQRAVDVEELANLGLKFCDEIETAVIAGEEKMGHAFEAAFKLCKVLEDLSEHDPDFKWTYTFIMEPVGGALVTGNLETIKDGLHLLRVVLAERISDELAEAYENAPPKIGSA
jgi:hypothetical protein